MKFVPMGLRLLLAGATMCLAVLGCGGSGSAGSTTQSPEAVGSATPDEDPPVPPSVIVRNPILFAAQVPVLEDFGARGSTFANHMTAISSVPRGGDLMIRYPNGRLRNLTKEAGFGMDGLQGDKAIAVREPSVHWSGTKAVFSMVIGAPTARFQQATYFWQLYEVSGLGRGEAVSIRKVANQPAGYNNVSPFYGTDDRILFTSDRPRGGEAHLYPQLDEYESTPTVTGIWSLNPASGDLRLLNHTVSGAFSPFIDSFGRVIFTRWDHLQRDQQADAASIVDFADESPGAARLATRTEVFPESREGQDSVYGPVAPYLNNLFTPWQMNEDGSDEETLNHIGRHELSFGFLPRSFKSDPALSDSTDDTLHANRKYIRADTGLFHIKEDPLQPGTYYATNAREFGSLTTGQILRFNGAPSVNAEQVELTDASPAETSAGLPGGRFRNPLPLSDGKFIATHTPTMDATIAKLGEMRLKELLPEGEGGTLVASDAVTAGIRKAVSWWDPDVKRNFDGLLWELEAVEVVARARPKSAAAALDAPERAVLADVGVSEDELRNWLVKNNLALIVTRNNTSRDRADRTQPFNLQVPGGVKTVAPDGGKVYDVAHLQVFQADLVRSYLGGRRPLARPLNDPAAKNIANPSGPSGSVKLASDGSSAAFVPARRALVWQLTDAAGHPVVRERVWVTFQPGEVRVCASCHGTNQANQAGEPAPTNQPEALRALLQSWRTLPK